jgi:cytochrome bd ubiquinol oxidase subunit I
VPTSSIASSFLPLLAAEEPSSLLAARWQMAISLGWHIVLACFGVAFPMLIWVVHRRGIRDGDDVALGLAKRWSKVAAVLFAVGAVSGTILSFEMGLLWPELMRTYGDVIGLPFALEGIAFFTEAIFIGIYLYGWGRLPPKVHLATLVPIALSGFVGTFCILSVNAWMNTPAGFRLLDGIVTDVDPWAAMFNPGVWVQFAHMWVATVMVVGFCTAAVYATGLLRGRDDRHHRLGFRVGFAFAAAAALVQPIIGHLAGARLADAQPTKLAAIELAPRTEQPAPLALGGLLIDGERRFAVEIPRLGSFISRGSVDRPVVGLEEFADEDRPRDALVNVVHLSFQGMVGIGLALAALGALFWWRTRRGADLLRSRGFLWVALLAGPASVAALQLGWLTTELGRQPWVVYRRMLVEDAVTLGSGVWVTLTAVVVGYAGMTVMAVLTLRSMADRWRKGEPLDLPTPYSPTATPHRSDAGVS